MASPSKEAEGDFKPVKRELFSPVEEGEDEDKNEGKITRSQSVPPNSKLLPRFGQVRHFSYRFC